jgi:hypothetical protein
MYDGAQIPAYYSSPLPPIPPAASIPPAPAGIEPQLWVAFYNADRHVTKVDIFHKF